MTQIIGLHGVGGSSKSFDILFSNLKNAIAFDLYHFETLEEIISFLHYKIKEPVIFIGHSFGAYVSVKFALLYPHLVEKLVLITPVGLFTHSNIFTAYWGMFFKYNMPSRILACFGDPAAAFRIPLPLEHDAGYVWWSDPYYHKLPLEKTTIIFAENDTIIAPIPEIGHVVVGAAHQTILKHPELVRLIDKPKEVVQIAIENKKTSFWGTTLYI